MAGLSDRKDIQHVKKAFRKPSKVSFQKWWKRKTRGRDQLIQAYWKNDH